MKANDFYYQNDTAIEAIREEHKEGISEEDFQCLIERVSELPDLCGKPITSEQLFDVFEEAVESYDDIDMEHFAETGEEKHSKTIAGSIIYAVSSVFNDDEMTEAVTDAFGDDPSIK